MEKSLVVYKKVFKNVCDWELGNLFRENEFQSKYEEDLWIDWNKVGKDFLSLKSTIKKINGGLDWLKGPFTDHIKLRKNYYNKFTFRNEHIISENIIQSIDNL